MFGRVVWIRVTSRSKSSKGSKPRTGRTAGSKFIVLLAGVALLFIVWRIINRGSGPDDDAMVRSLVTAEETALALSANMKALSRDVMEGRLPGPSTAAAGVFAADLSVLDLGPAPAWGETGVPSFETHPWPVAPEMTQVTQVNLWRPLLEAVDTFEHARLHIMSGDHPEEDPYRFESGARFRAMARMKTGEWRSLQGTLRIDWQRPEGQAKGWQITAWRTETLTWIASPQRLFAESLDQAMRGGAPAAAALRRSQHYEATVEYYRNGMQMPHPYFAPISANQKPGIAVSDVNGDGFDDIYITVRLGKNLLLVNQGDGTFVEQGAVYKLDLPGHTPCSLFADFDNDGDLDVILGRSLLRTSYIENRGGVFYQHQIPAYMPMAVIAMAAADYNMDGLLDVYMCTYRPAAPMGASPAGGVALSKEGELDWQDEFLTPDQAREYRRREAENKEQTGGSVLDQVGPPNVLLVNRGGGQFEVAPESHVVGVWRNSLQSTWGDYNEDGRPDLYIANDWALDTLFRNDGPAGFTDVSEEVGITSYGFTMGATWGDYDNDGLEDLYVSNMYSDPGRRMTDRIPGVDPMFIESALGNFLYRRQADGTFRQVAGMEPASMMVMNAGWSWGGCFVDFDNDRFLDLYVLSGYFSAPKELDSGLDLESNLWRTMLRTDQNLARRSFRFSREWKRTGAPDNLGPEIDARLSGVERQGGGIKVHSLNGHERNRYFLNQEGRRFTDISAVSGLDHIADSRGFAVLDYDRDGWQDVALVNANQPLFNLYHNEMAAAGFRGGIIALRFIGGNKTAAPSTEWSCRDGFGARVAVDLGEETLVREHRCGDGWSTQNSPTMILGIGSHDLVPSVSVKWPSGKVSTTRDVPEGTLLSVYEDPADGPDGEAFVRALYRVPPRSP